MLGYAAWVALFVAAWIGQGALYAALFMVIYFIVTVPVRLLVTPFEAAIGNLAFLDWHHFAHGESSLSPREAAQMASGAVTAHKQTRFAHKIAIGGAFGWIGLTVLALWLSRVAHLNVTLQALMSVAMAAAVLIFYLDKYQTGMVRSWGEWVFGLVVVWVGSALAGGPR